MNTKPTLPPIDDARVTPCIYFNSEGYSINVGGGMHEIICGPDAHKRTINYLKKLDGKL